MLLARIPKTRGGLDHPNWTTTTPDGRGTMLAVSPALRDRLAVLRKRQAQRTISLERLRERDAMAAVPRTTARGIVRLPFQGGLDRPAPSWRDAAAYLRDAAILAALYYGSAKLGYELRFTGPIAGIVWLPVGVAISYLSIRGLRFWPGAVVGDLLANDYSQLSLVGGVGQSFGNVAEVLVAAWLLRRLMRGGSPLQSLRGVSGMLLAIAAGTAVSAIVGPLSLLATGSLGSEHLPTVMRTWWLADASGALLVVPVALAWFAHPPPRRIHFSPRGAVLMLAVVTAAAWFSTRGSRSLDDLIFPVLIVTALRFGSRGASVAVAITASFAIWETTHNRGPFSYTSITHSVLTTQLFIAVSAISALLLVGLVLEREIAVERLLTARLDVVRAGYLERHRIERELHDGVQQRMLALLALLVTARHEAAPDVRRALTRAEGEVRTAMTELRELAAGTFPPVLTEAGLARAVEEMAADAEVDIELTELPPGRFDVAAEAAAYSVVAEALSSARTHGHAALVRIAIAAADGGLHISVSDDGRGGDQSSELAELRERIRSFGGTFDVSSPPEGGTRYDAVIPTE
jgi:signal transduction histidine kinase